MLLQHLCVISNPIPKATVRSDPVVPDPLEHCEIRISSKPLGPQPPHFTFDFFSFGIHLRHQSLPSASGHCQQQCVAESRISRVCCLEKYCRRDNYGVSRRARCPLDWPNRICVNDVAPDVAIKQDAHMDNAGSTVGSGPSSLALALVRGQCDAQPAVGRTAKRWHLGLAVLPPRASSVATKKPPPGVTGRWRLGLNETR